MNIIAASEKGMYFHRLNLFGKFTGFDFFTYQEINQVKFGKGWLQRPTMFLFFNGRKLKVKAQLKDGYLFVDEIGSGSHILICK